MKWLALALLVATPVAAQEVRLFPVPPALEPPDTVRFSHKKHLRFGDTCEDCHPDAVEATTTAASLMPKKLFCWDCHDEEDEGQDCGMCHTNAESPSAKWRSHTTELVFDHKGHLAQDGVSCETCHPAAKKSEESTDVLTPDMATCTTCHAREMDRLACTSCHTQLPELGPPGQELIHGSTFFALHGAWARGASVQCAQCHEQQFCSDCHAQTAVVRPSVMHPMAVERSFVHRGDFLGRHALEASASPGTCQSCHGTTFCSDCHGAQLATLSFATSPHPPGWLRGEGGVESHGRAARTRIEQCAACHDQGAASNCVECHRVGGIGGDPHPPGFGRNAGPGQKHTSGTCVPCHTTRP